MSESPEHNEPEQDDTVANEAGASEANEPADDPVTIAALQDQLSATAAERDANHEKWLRSEAEMDNVRRRTKKELSDSRDYQALPLVRDLLPALDNLQRAVQAAEGSGNVGELVEGIRMVQQQLEDVFGRHGAKPISGNPGDAFDPNFHQAIQQIPTAEFEPMTIMQEVERGYKIKDRVVRPGTVIVACAPPEPTSDEATSSDTETESD